jgi:DNA excision repair protein ERCC-4
VADGLTFPRASHRIPPAMRLDAPPERPLVIIADTREGLVPPFPSNVVVERGTLSTGDYSTPALRDVAAIERKAPGDLLSSLTHERDRFDREMTRAADLDAFAIVVEAGLDDALAARPGVSWQSVVSSLASFAARGIPTYFLGSPLAAGRFIAGLLMRWERVLLPKPARAERLRDAANALFLRDNHVHRGMREMVEREHRRELAWESRARES